MTINQELTNEITAARRLAVQDYDSRLRVLAVMTEAGVKVQEVKAKGYCAHASVSLKASDNKSAAQLLAQFSPEPSAMVFQESVPSLKPLLFVRQEEHQRFNVLPVVPYEITISKASRVLTWVTDLYGTGEMVLRINLKFEHSVEMASAMREVLNSRLVDAVEYEVPGGQVYRQVPPFKRVSVNALAIYELGDIIAEACLPYIEDRVAQTWLTHVVTEMAALNENNPSAADIVEQSFSRFKNNEVSEELKQVMAKVAPLIEPTVSKTLNQLAQCHQALKKLFDAKGIPLLTPSAIPFFEKALRQYLKEVVGVQVEWVELRNLTTCVEVLLAPAGLPRSIVACETYRASTFMRLQEVPAEHEPVHP